MFQIVYLHLIEEKPALIVVGEKGGYQTEESAKKDLKAILERNPDWINYQFYTIPLNPIQI